MKLTSGGNALPKAMRRPPQRHFGILDARLAKQKYMLGATRHFRSLSRSAIAKPLL